MSDLPTPTADGARVLAGASGPQETTETPFRFAIAGDQGDVQSAKLANGRILLVWTEAGNIMRQTFEANGTPEGSPAAIASTGDAESQPAVSVLADGRVVVIWTVLSGGNYDVMAQTFTVSGPPGPPTVTAGPLLTVADDVAPAASAAPAPDVAALADGGFAVTWVDGDGDGVTITADVMARVYEADLSAGAAFAVANAGDSNGAAANGNVDELRPSIEGLPEGGFVLAWESVTRGASAASDQIAVAARLYNQAGQPVAGSSFSVSDGTGGGFERSPEIVVLPSNEYIVVWSDQQGGTNDIVAQRFNANGAAAGGPATIVGNSGDGQDFSEYTPTISLLNDGGFAVSWLRPLVSSNTAVVFTRTLNADLTPRGPEVTVTVPSNAPGINHEALRTTVMEDGRILLTWIEPPPLFGGGPPPGAQGADIRYQFFDPGTGAPFRAVDDQLVTLPTDVRLFDTDGSEVLQQVKIDNLFDFTGDVFVDPSNPGTQLGEFDYNFDWFIPGGNGDFSEASYVIDRRQGAEEAAFLDALAAGQANLTLDLAPGSFSRQLFITAASREGTDPDAGFSQVAWNLNLPIMIEGKATPLISVDAAITFTENDPPTVIDGDLALSDADGTLAGATVRVFTNFRPGEDVLAFTPTGGITGSYDPLTGILTLTGIASVADYQTVLRSVTFENTSNPPTGGARTVLFEVNDGDASFNPAEQYLTGTATNPTALATGDINGDTVPDIVAVLEGTDQVSVMLGNGDGSFRPQFTALSTFAIGDVPTSVAIANLNGDASPDLVVTNSIGDTVGVLFGNGNGTFQPQQTATGASLNAPVDVVAANFDGDTDVDLAVARRDDGVITLLTNNGAGVFANGGNFDSAGAVGADFRPVALAAADFDGDTDLDLVVANTSAGTGAVSILVNTAGVFASLPVIAVGVNNPSDVAVGDFNEDGLSDFVVSNLGNDTVSIFLRTAPATFAAPLTLAAGIDPNSVAVADLNGDGNLDIAAANRTTFGTVSVFHGNGSGGFAPRITFESPGLADAIVAGDFNADGQVDLATANIASQNPPFNNIAILLNDTSQGDALDRAAVTVAALPNDLPVVDLDGPGGTVDFTTAFTEDAGAVAIGDTDLTVTDADGNSIVGAVVTLTNALAGDTLTLSGALPGGISPVVTTPAGQVVLTLSGSASAADYQAALRLVQFNSTSQDPTNGGANPSRTVTIVVNDGTANSATATSTINVTGVNDAPVNVVPGAQAVNEDTNLAITGLSFSDAEATAPVTTVTLSVLHGTITVRTDVVGGLDASEVTGNGTGTVTLSCTPAVINSTLAASNGVIYRPHADYNGSDTLTMTSNDGGATGVDPGGPGGDSNSEQDTDTVAITVNAVNDGPRIAVPGNLDALVVNQNSDNVSVLVGNGSGNFTPAAGSPVDVGTGTPDEPYSVALGDLDGDGDLDALVANSNGNSDSVSLLLGDGVGGFTLGSPVATGDSPLSVALGDIDGDGDLDALTANSGDSNVSVLRNNGLGIFTALAPVATGTVPLAVALGDIDGDGDLDALTTNLVDNTVSVLLNNGLGDGTFTAAPAIPGVSGPSLAIGDVNGDGHLDVLVASVADDRVHVLLGNGWGGFTAAAGSPIDPGGMGPASVALGDVDGDLDLDALVANKDSGDVSVLINDGAGVFTEPGSPVTVGTVPSSVALGDVNGDGDLDAVVANFGSETRTVLINSGAGVFTAQPANVTGGNGPNAVALGDVNPSQTTAEDTPLVFSTGLDRPIVISDIDAGTGDLTVTLTVTNGTLTLGAIPAGLSFTAPADGIADASMTFAGSLTEINTALDGLTYQPNSNYNGSDNLKITVNDSGNVGTGGARSAVRTIALVVTAVSDPPTANADARSVLEYQAATGNVVAGDAFGGQSDTVGDGPGPLTVTAITGFNGAGAVGASLLGQHGHLTIQSDGSYGYVADDAEPLAVGSTVQDVFTYTVSDGVASANASLTVTVTGSNVGNGVDNQLLGTAGDDTLYGAGGDDTMTGGPGDDFYEVTESGDVVVEQPGEGMNDRIWAYVDYTLPDNVEHLILLAPATTGVGNSGDNVIRGNDLDNVLYGAGGHDVMFGGKGNDFFEVDSSDDQVVELAGEGTNDRVWSSADYVLPVNVENLTLIGSAESGTGNAEGNVIHGNVIANRITGAGGDDLLFGQAGGDTFVFGLNFGHDVLADFQGGAGPSDTLEFSKTVFADEAAFRAASHQIGADVVVVFNAANHIVIANTTLAQIHTDDLAFV